MDEQIADAKQLIEALNKVLTELAREGVRAEVEVLSRNYIGTGMGEEGVQLQATFLRRL